ncbi:MAG: hypothetical protein ABIZ56_10270 [Chthoniobacteraceae bacterium]
MEPRRTGQREAAMLRAAALRAEHVGLARRRRQDLAIGQPH